MFVTLPSGLRMITRLTSSIVLSDSTNPLSVTATTDVININGANSTITFTANVSFTPRPRWREDPPRRRAARAAPARARDDWLGCGVRGGHPSCTPRRARWRSCASSHPALKREASPRCCGNTHCASCGSSCEPPMRCNSRQAWRQPRAGPQLSRSCVSTVRLAAARRGTRGGRRRRRQHADPQDRRPRGHPLCCARDRPLPRPRGAGGEDVRHLVRAPRVALLHTPRRIATHPASQCFTPRVALLHTPRRIAAHPASHCCTPRVALLHPTRRIATHPASHCYTPRVALLRTPRRIATRPVSHCYTPRVTLLHPMVLLRLRHGWFQTP
jgi:hypothetical protein